MPSPAFEAAYDAVLAQWPIAPEVVDVPTAHGTTRVYVTGPADGAPLVLLHGGGATAAVWFANAGELSRDHRVFAVDDGGRTVGSADELVEWLGAVLDGLELPSAALGGHSYGAWTVLTFALHHAKRVTKLALLDPTDCFTGLGLSYRFHALPLFLRPSAGRLRRFLAWETDGADLDPAWLELVALGADEPRPKIVLPHPPAAERFAGFTVPTLLVLAGSSRAHDVHKVLANARRLLPQAVTTVLPGATHHTMPTENAAPLNKALLEFLA